MIQKKNKVYTKKARNWYDVRIQNWSKQYMMSPRKLRWICERIAALFPRFTQKYHKSAAGVYEYFFPFYTHLENKNVCDL